MQTTLTLSIPLPPLTLAGFQEPKAAPDSPVPVTAGAAGTATTSGTTVPTPGAAQQPEGPCGGQTTFLYLAVFMALMYFMVLRPEQKRKKEQQSLLSSVKQGDRVVTLGGMHGTVVRLTDKTVVLRVDAVNMTYDRVAIARVERDEAPAPDAKA